MLIGNLGQEFFSEDDGFKGKGKGEMLEASMAVLRPVDALLCVPLVTSLFYNSISLQSQMAILGF